jgi:hypothetical protein
VRIFRKREAPAPKELSADMRAAGYETCPFCQGSKRKGVRCPLCRDRGWLEPDLLPRNPE